MDNRNFKKYLQYLLKIPTLNIEMQDGYKYLLTVNARVLDEYCKYGNVANKIVHKLNQNKKIDYVSDWFYKTNYDFQNRTIQVIFKKC